MLQIRPFVERDYEEITAVWNAAWPDFKKTAFEFKSSDERRNPQYFWQRLVVEEDGRLLGYGEIEAAYWSKSEGHYAAKFITHPHYLGQGAASLFYEHMLATLQERGDLHYLSTETREDCPEAIHFLTEHGFEQVMRFPISHLDVSTFDATLYDEKLAEVKAAGIEILSLAELQKRDADWKIKIHRIIADTLQDVPSPDEMSDFTFDELDRALGSPNFLPEGVFLAVDGEQVVAISELWRSLADPHKLLTGLTGVVRSHRRRGLATAVKIHAIRFAQAYGATILETDNEENNPMFQLNLQLGFQERPAFVEFKKTVEPL
jgi:GNAT superfamily N-acetyltransferase